MNKYLSSEPWWAGYSNVRMSTEIALAISEISNRTYILPPSVYLDGICHWKGKEKYIDLLDIWDQEALFDTFKCVKYSEVDDYRNIGGKTFYSNVENIASIMIYSDKYNELFPLKDGIHFVTINDISSITDMEDFNKFADGRPIFDVDHPSKYIHFPRNLFGHFYYCVYASLEKRNQIKKKIINGIKFKREHIDRIDFIISQLGLFNAIHVRRGDFKITRPNMYKSFDDIPKYLESNLKNSNLPLFIATDEKDKSIFNNLRDAYDIHFLNDYLDGLNSLESTIYDQIIPSYAEQFLGSKMSTYSDYINVNRASIGKDVNTRLGSNYIKKPLKYKKFPWEAERYSWEHLYSYYWELE